MSYIGRLARMSNDQLQVELRHLTLAWVECAYDDRSREGFAIYRALLYCRGECRERGMHELILTAKTEAMAEIRERRRNERPTFGGKHHGDCANATPKQ